MFAGDEDDGSEQRSALVCLVPDHMSADDGHNGHADGHAEGGQGPAAQRPLHHLHRPPGLRHRRHLLLVSGHHISCLSHCLVCAGCLHTSLVALSE